MLVNEWSSNSQQTSLQGDSANFINMAMAGPPLVASGKLVVVVGITIESALHFTGVTHGICEPGSKMLYKVKSIEVCSI